MQPRFLTALPVFNEEAHVLDVLTEVRKHADDVLVVDDGSSDRTPLLLAELEGVQVVTHPVNRGYGAALVSAFEATIEQGYDALVTIDCDGQHQPHLIREMVQQLSSHEGEPVDIVSGSRYLQLFDGDSIPPEDRRRINVEITQQLNDRLGFQLTDTFCGFMAYRRDAIEQLDITEFGYGMPLQLRLSAGILCSDDFETTMLAIENHVNYVVHNDRRLSLEEATGITALFNSALLDRYFRSFSGNTQVNATEVRTMKFPTLDIIREIGHQLVADADVSHETVVMDRLGVDGDMRTYLEGFRR